jgi:hypothetical protein
MNHLALWRRPSVIVLMAAVFLLPLPTSVDAQAEGRSPRLSVKAADPREQGDGTLSAAAAAAIATGALAFGDDDAAAKIAANRAHAQSRGTGVWPARPSEFAALGGLAKTPAIVGGVNFEGLDDARSTPPDTSGAIGPNRYVQVVNQRAGIFRPRSGSPVAVGPLNLLAGTAPIVKTFQPQIIWDATTDRFYYLAVSIFSSVDHRISFGFSRTPSPDDLTASWCKYSIPYGVRFPNFPVLGDNEHFLIVGSNMFGGDPQRFVGSDITAVSKPPAGTNCPAPDSFKLAFRAPLRDTHRAYVFSPVPANQIDNNPTGYVVARPGKMPASEFWFFNVIRNATTGEPIIQDGRSVKVADYSVPPDAAQPVVTQTLDTLDGRLTQAVQAVNPQRGTSSLWTQHTIAVGARAGVRWYEIDPAPATPTVLRRGTITFAGGFAFNAAISPDRRVQGARSAFGSNFVINYNAVSRRNNIHPRIVAASSVGGGPLEFVLVQDGVGPYKDSSCAKAGSRCRWGAHAAASPDPRPSNDRPLLDRGSVWGTNQFSGVVNPSTNSAQWRTRVFQLSP